MSAEAPAPPLDAATRARGRRLAITSHPPGMTHRNVFTEWLPTLALVQLGASESVVGLQGSLEPFAQTLQLPTMRAMGRFAKRTLLIGGQALAVLGGLPMLGFAALEAHAAAGGADAAIAVVLASFAVCTVGIVVSQTVWFPLLRSYVEPGAIGRFFGTLRSVWHVALIAFFLGSASWLASNPGALGPLFAVGLACGLLRIVLIARLPERSERTGGPIRVREALALLRTEPALRSYLLGAGVQSALRSATLPFVIVMMRRVLGLSDAQVLVTTAASFAGGLASLYLWGRVVDARGPAWVFRWTTLGLAASFVALLAAPSLGSGVLVAMVGIFFVRAVLTAGFGVADTRVLFELAPEHAPVRTIVVSAVSISLLRGVAPLVVGALLERALEAGAAPASAYRALFAVAGAVQLAVFLPLRRFRA